MPTAPRTHRLSRTVAASLAVAALAAPAAAARPAYDTPSPPDSGPAPTSVDTAATSAPAPSPPVVRSIDEGFDWGAAGIAAGATAGVVLLGLGGVSSRRRSHPRRAVAG